MITAIPEQPAAVPLVTPAVRPAGTPPVLTSPPQPDVTPPPGSGAPAPVAVAVDPLPALLQTVTEIQGTQATSADLARRYAESGALTQRAASAVATPVETPVTRVAPVTTVAEPAQAFRQAATATPLPQLANVTREIANAQLPNAPATAGNAPAVIVVDGRALPLTPTQAATIRSVISLTGSPEAKLAGATAQPTLQDAKSIPLPQPASALRELANAQIQQPAQIAREQATLAAPTPRDPLAALLTQVAMQSREAASATPIPLQNSAAVRELVALFPPSQREAIATQLASATTSPNPSIVIDGRTIPLTPAQAALVRSQLGVSARKIGPGTAGDDADDPTVQSRPNAMASEQNEKVEPVEPADRNLPRSTERYGRPPQGELPRFGTDGAPVERVEAVRAVRGDQPTPYEPQHIINPQNPLALAPAPDRVILAGHAPADVAAHPAVTGIAIGLAPGITREHVSIEQTSEGHVVSFAGSSDQIVVRAQAGCTAQLIFADGSALRLHLDPG